MRKKLLAVVLIAVAAVVLFALWNLPYDGNRTPYRTDRALTGFEVHDYAAAISFGMPYEPEDSQYGKY